MNLTKYADAGLHGWKGKVDERVAGGDAADSGQVKLAAGALAFLLSLRYVAKTVAAVAPQR